MNVTFKKGEPRFVDYTPAADVAAGEVKVVGNLPMISHLVGGFTYDSSRPSRMMALAVGGGIYSCIGDAAISVGKLVYWNDADNKVTETRGSNKTFGFTVSACSGDGASCDVLHMPLGAVDLEAVAAVVATLTDSTGLSGSHDDTLAATTVPADITGGQSPTEAEHNEALAVMRVLAQNQSDLAQKIIEILANLKTAGIMASS